MTFGSADNNHSIDGGIDDDEEDDYDYFEYRVGHVITLIRSARTSCTRWTRPPTIKIWITCIQAYMPLDHQKTHQTKPNQTSPLTLMDP